MYIAHEQIASNDPRLDDRIVEIGKWWMYQIVYVDTQAHPDIRTDWLNGVELPENVAKAHIFAASVDGELTVLKKVFNDTTEIILPSSGGNQEYFKEMYDLTETDKANARDFIKTILKLHVKNHLPMETGMNPAGTDTRLYNVIDNAGTLNDIQKVMKHYFDVDACAYTAGIKRNPEFPVNW
jgi:hypothetical protein